MIERPELKNIPILPEERRLYFGRKYGQLFGWIPGPDQLFLCSILPEIANDFNNPINIVEIGVFAGSTTRGLISMTGGMVTGIDDFSDFEGEGRRSLQHFNSGQDMFWATIKEAGVDLSDHIKRLIISKSQDVEWGEPIDFLFIDGDHHYEPAKADILLFSKHVVSNGIVLIDDWDMESVRKAVNECLPDEQWERIRIPVEDGSNGKMFCARRK